MSGSSGGRGEEARSLKARALDELRAFSAIARYLWLFLGSFTVYRKLILAETGVTYVHYGVALVLVAQNWEPPALAKAAP